MARNRFARRSGRLSSATGVVALVLLLVGSGLLLAGCVTYQASASTRTTIQVDPARLDFGDSQTRLSFLIKFGETGNSLDWRIVDAPDWVTPEPYSGSGVEVVWVTADRFLVGQGETKAKMRVVGSTDYADVELRIRR